ncbi:MAG: rRNA maturation RNase YbeY [Bacteroidetes bacterium]|nr:rRNA maturation RNase YbeY [Bacteroidota bacterium]
MPIQFHNADIRFSLKQKRKIQRFIHYQITTLSNYQIGSLDFIFCSDDYLLNINHRFLKHDYYTDIITFDLSEKGDAKTRDEQSLVSEIYISVDRVKENSLKFEQTKVADLKLEANMRNPPSGAKRSTPPNQNFESELLRVIFHGVLHLLGYKDKTVKQKKEMRKMEEKWLLWFADYN